MGAALGSIMPTIITHHITNISTKSAKVHGWKPRVIAIPAMSAMPASPMPGMRAASSAR